MSIVRMPNWLLKPLRLGVQGATIGKLLDKKDLSRSAKKVFRFRLACQEIERQGKQAEDVIPYAHGQKNELYEKWKEIVSEVRTPFPGVLKKK